MGNYTIYISFSAEIKAFPVEADKVTFFDNGISVEQEGKPKGVFWSFWVGIGPFRRYQRQALGYVLNEPARNPDEQAANKGEIPKSSFIREPLDW